MVSTFILRCRKVRFKDDDNIEREDPSVQRKGLGAVPNEDLSENKAQQNGMGSQDGFEKQ